MINYTETYNKIKTSGKYTKIALLAASVVSAWFIYTNITLIILLGVIVYVWNQPNKKR